MVKSDLVSIIIATKNEQDVIGDLLQSIDDLTVTHIDRLKKAIKLKYTMLG